MKTKIVIVFFLLILAGFTVKPVLAHPGRTAADGCHYCRTNCEQYGVPYNERHCHGGGSSTGSTGSTDTTSNNIAPIVPVVQATTAPVVQQPLPTYKPLPIYKPKPTFKPTTTPTPYIETVNDKNKLFLVTQVVDGDTIKVNVRGNIESVRLLAIDTPETVDPRKPVQCFGKEASNKMSALVSNKYLKLVDDRTQGQRDKYKRLLRYAYDGNIFINREMVAQGYATSYKQYPTKYLNEFNNLEIQAREKNLGLWSVCK